MLQSFTTPKITPDQVRAIRADGRAAKEIAEDYNITDVSVWNIKAGRTWKWVR